MVAKVAVSKAIYAIDKPYDYLVPPELEGQVLPGMRVAVPFGSGNRGSDGIVLSLERQEENTPTLKPVLSCLDDAPVLDEKGIQLALWMRERYFCTVSDAVKAMLPAGMYFALRDSVTLVPGAGAGTDLESALGRSSCRQAGGDALLLGGERDMTQIHTAFGAKDPTPAIRVLLDRKIAVLETSAQRAVGDKTEPAGRAEYAGRGGHGAGRLQTEASSPALRGDGAPLHSGGSLHQGALLFYRRLSRHAAISGKERNPHPGEA